MKNRWKFLLLAVILVGAGVAGFTIYRLVTGPPKIVRLLPDGDALVYVNLKPAHLFDLTKGKPPQLDPEYQDFVQQTGIQFERDLDEVALSRQDSTNGMDIESSEIFAGRFDHDRLAGYLQKISSGKEALGDLTIFSIAHDGHTVRVCILNPGLVAVTNMASPEPMHTMIRHVASTFSAPAGTSSLLTSYYSKVPTASLAWAIIHINGRPNMPQLPGGFNFSFLENSVAVASLRYSSDVLLRAEIFSRNEEDAKQVTDSANAFVSLYHGAAKAIGTSGTDQAVKEAFDSVQVERNGIATAITAKIPQALVKKIASEIRQENEKAYRP
jgi:hypothetical protein